MRYTKALNEATNKKPASVVLDLSTVGLLLDYSLLPKEVRDQLLQKVIEQVKGEVNMGKKRYDEPEEEEEDWGEEDEDYEEEDDELDENDEFE